MFNKKIARHTTGVKDNKFVKFCNFFIFKKTKTYHLQSIYQGIVFFNMGSAPLFDRRKPKCHLLLKRNIQLLAT